MAGEFQSQFNDAMREAELDDLKREVTGLKDQASKLAGPNPFQIARDELKNAWDDKPAPAPSALSGGTPKADPESDIPSAFAPRPAIEAPAEPPAPTEAEFAPTPEAEPGPRPKRARKSAAKANGAVKPGVAKPDDETAEPPPGAAA
ncbi:twin-arginine translocase subunit TatB [Hansschlegelia zhihuaiae]|uniref:Twin-arginine translocase subunit TatB n=2 Tax=Hansschlegelia zhihuaiae TaxID=405005 RepID=A0A4Q0MLH5_9HYPH|nr:twin-arginine translocase subunit TatB [Hansschlegelia zhihuaiae]